MVKRKTFICRCGLESSKTIPNYYAQIRRLGYPLCTDCSIKLNAKNTSDRLKLKYSSDTKNNDIVIHPCSKCGKDRQIRYRTKKQGYDLCKSCAAIQNRINNKSVYDNLAKSRINNNEFRGKVSDGMLQQPEELRILRSNIAHTKRWSQNQSQRLELFLEQATHLHDERYDYSNVDYINHITEVEIICKEHGPFLRTPKQHARDGYGCPRCSDLRVVSKAHSELNDFLNKNGFTTILNVKDVIDPYELDIVIESHKLAIEHHGIYWHSYNVKESAKERLYHQNKALLSQSKGLKLLQIFETEWLLKRQIVENIIKSKLGITQKLHARKCIIKELNDNSYKIFMDDNHLQGYRSASYKIGLFYNDYLYEAIGISKHAKYGFELIRLATKSGYTVVGGLSKLLNRAHQDLRMYNLLTYADRRYSTGDSYLKCGFDYIGLTEPNYYYTKGYKNKPLSSRQMFQKHKLNKRLEIYNDNLTEYENMFANGYRRIWDAGHIKLMKKW